MYEQIVILKRKSSAIFQNVDATTVVIIEKEREIQKVYTNSLVKADSFYANFTDTTFQKIHIPHLIRTVH